MRYAVKGNIILPDKILYGGTVEVENGIIIRVLTEGHKSAIKRIYDLSGKYIAPGFVDIHCHGSLSYFGSENPQAAAKEHRLHGTTSMLISLYRNLNHAKTLLAIEKIKQAMKSQKNIVGVHMEGPYINPSLGSKSVSGVNIIQSEYREIIDTGVVKQWTFSPEVEGSLDFCRCIAANGIVPSIGHSRASRRQVREAAGCGAKIVTHIMDATGAEIEPSRYAGTKEVDFDSACLLEDGFYYEVINDKCGIHVRHDMIRLIIKTVGTDRVVGITDCYTGEDDGSDVNFCGKELTGSKLTMDSVAKNFLELGLPLCDVFKITSLNPATAIGMQNEIGQIKEGCKAYLLITDEKLERIEVFENA